MRTSLVCILLLLYGIRVPAQKENNNWIFGNHIGIDFNGAAPAIRSSAIDAYESCASVSDPGGRLLFYSDGQFVWDRMHNPMPNGTIRSSSSRSSTQGVVICPVPGDPEKYLLFTLEEEGGVVTAGTLSYSLVDMTLNGGRGDVVAGKKNLFLADSMSEKMLLAPSCNGFWVITHHLDSPVFYAFEVLSAATIRPAVISRTEGVVQHRNYVRGQMTLSADFKSLAIGNLFLPSPLPAKEPVRLEVFDFDPVDGRVKDCRFSDPIGSVYSVEFSQDKSKLYATTAFDRALHQYDLSLLPDRAAVKASQYSFRDTSYYGMRRGPDQKIYLNNMKSPGDISCIHQPGKPGPACALEKNVPSLHSVTALSFLSFGTNTIGRLRLLSDVVFSKTDTLLCQGAIIELNAKDGALSCTWNDGNTDCTRTFTKETICWRRSEYPCRTRIDTFVIRFRKTKDSILSNTDHSLCSGESILTNAAEGYDNCFWSDGNTSCTRSLSQEGVYWRKSEASCTVSVDTIRIHHRVFDTVSYGVWNRVACFEQSLRVDAPVSGYYLWNDGRDAAYADFYAGGTKWVFTKPEDKYCTIRVDTYAVDFVNFELNVPDTGLCRDEEIVLTVSVPGATEYRWSNNSGGNNLRINRSGSYWVEAAVRECRKTDSFEVRSKAFQPRLGPDTTLCTGKLYLLIPGEGRDHFLWQDGSTDTVFRVTNSGNYEVTLLRDGCYESAAVRIDYKDCIDCVDIPNAFTPNGDGRNDLFRPLVSCPVWQSNFIVVNRYGQQVFTSTASAWDGTFNGQPLETGTYYYLFRITFDYPGAQEELYKGDVALLR